MIRNVLKTILFCMIFMFLYTPSNTVTVKAMGIKSIDDFDNLNGDAQYLGKDYRDNYYLDIEKTGLLDSLEKGLNNLANVFFMLIRVIAYITVTVFYYSMNFDVGKLISPYINGIQKSLNDGIFEPLFLIGFAATVIVVLRKFIKRDLIGSAFEFGKVVLLVILTFLMMSRTSEILSAGTNVTKSVAVAALTGINNDKNVTSTSAYAADVAGVLWANLVHEPWITFEFGDIVGSKAATEATINSFLTTKPGTEEREKLVEKYMEDNPDSTSFDKATSGLKRIPFTLLYLVIMIVKCAIYLFVALIQLAFQAMAILYLLLAMVIFIMAMFPGYGMESISNWLRKIMDTQIGIVVITFALGLLVKFDSLLYALIPDYGWFVVLLLQIALIAGIILQRKKIITGLSNIQKVTSNPAYARAQLRKSGNLYDNVGKGMDSMNKSMNLRRNQSRSSSDGKNQVPRPRINTSIDFGSDSQKIKRQVRPKQSTSIKSENPTAENVIDFAEYKRQREANRPRLYRNEIDRKSIKVPNESAKKKYANYQVVKNAPEPAAGTNLKSHSISNVQEKPIAPQVKDNLREYKTHKVVRNAPKLVDGTNIKNSTRTLKSDNAALQNEKESIHQSKEKIEVSRPSTIQLKNESSGSVNNESGSAAQVNQRHSEKINMSSNKGTSQKSVSGNSHVTTQKLQRNELPAQVKDYTRQNENKEEVKRPNTSNVSAQSLNKVVQMPQKQPKNKNEGINTVSTNITANSGKIQAQNKEAIRPNSTSNSAAKKEDKIVRPKISTGSEELFKDKVMVEAPKKSIVKKEVVQKSSTEKISKIRDQSHEGKMTVEAPKKSTEKRDIVQRPKTEKSRETKEQIGKKEKKAK